MSDFAADWAAALSWLYGQDPGTRYAPVWPPQDPYVIVWCPHPRKPCRTGGVYWAPQGFVYLGVSRKHRKDYAEIRGYHAPGGTLLTYPDGSKRDYAFAGTPTPYCRHGRLNPVPGTRPLHDVIADIVAGRLPRPVSIVSRGQ